MPLKFKIFFFTTGRLPAYSEQPLPSKDSGDGDAHSDPLPLPPSIRCSFLSKSMVSGGGSGREASFFLFLLPDDAFFLLEDDDI